MPIEAKSSPKGRQYAYKLFSKTGALNAKERYSPKRRNNA